MDSVTGIIPEELLYPEHMGKVMEFLKSMPWPGHDKAKMLRSWARTVGVKIAASQINAVEETGNDR